MTRQRGLALCKRGLALCKLGLALCKLGLFGVPTTESCAAVESRVMGRTLDLCRPWCNMGVCWALGFVCPCLWSSLLPGAFGPSFEVWKKCVGDWINLPP